MSVEKFRNSEPSTSPWAAAVHFPIGMHPQGKPRTFACRTTRVSPFRDAGRGPGGRIKVGDRLNSYFRDFGTFDGLISETGAAASCSNRR